MDKQFVDIEREFNILTRKFRQKRISEREYKDKLKKLRLKDTDGKCWTIGARTGKWYYFDGKKWIESQPPSIQEGKAICIYCGYENDITTLTCEYCGGNLGDKIYVCPECNTKLDDPAQECPTCAGETKAFESIGDVKEVAFENDLPIEDENSPNHIIRAVSPLTCFLFAGIFGLFIGLIFGVFVGTTPFFSAMITLFPNFLQEIQGKLLGGVVFGLLGGVFGFAIIAALGFLMAMIINGILLFMGGIKVRLDKI
ncbi:MAG: zinc ribbon domain-containing protein [Candidatus Aminicenantes bacterium]|jgi:hypothetical protein